MEFTIHHQVLLGALAIGAIVGVVANKTRFCTMGAVSDWVNMGDTGRMRSWLLAMAVALAGVMVLQATGLASVSGATFPPYRTPNFAWLRYIVGGLMFGIGMTLASGCGHKTLVRVGTGNLKSLCVLIIASICAYFMLWTGFYANAFNSWIAPTAIDLEAHGIRSQALGDLIAGLTGAGDGAAYNAWIGVLVAGALLVFTFASRDFRHSRDNVLGAVVIGCAIVAAWYLTGGAKGADWKEYAEMSTIPPSRVEMQSLTFISPMGDSLRYLVSPSNLLLLNFGIMALVGVILGSLVYAIASRTFRIEWFANAGDFGNHAMGGVLMGIGGILSMGCTIGQAITGVSTLAAGSFITFLAIVAGSAATMKVQYWRMLREA